MPPISPQGSRGGLITATVVFAVLCVTFAIFAIYFAVDDNKKTDQLATQIQKSKLIYGDVSSEQIETPIRNRAHPQSQPRADRSGGGDGRLADFGRSHWRKNPAAQKDPSVVVISARDAMAPP